MGRGPNGRCNPRAALTVLNDPPTTLRRKFRLNVVAMERAEAAYTVLEDNENFATADLQVQFVRGAKVGLLKALGRVVRRTRALAFCEGELRDEADQLVARGSATCSIVKRQ